MPNEITSPRFYWIKLKEDFFDDETIDFVMSQKNGPAYITLYLLLCLKSANQEGRLVFSLKDQILPYDIEKIRRETKYFDVDTIMNALSLFKKLGLIEETDGFMSMPGVSKMVGSEAANSHALRQKRYIERKKQSLSLNQGQQLALKEQDNTTQSVSKNDAINDVKNDKTHVSNVTQTVTQNDEEIERLEIRDRENRDKIIDTRDRDIEISQSPRSLEEKNNFSYFELFIEKYPRKIEPRKVLFVKNAWDKVAAGREEEILAALEDHVLNNADWTHEGGKFIPTAENWLLNEEFLNEPTPFTNKDKHLMTHEQQIAGFMEGPYGSVVNS